MIVVGLRVQADWQMLWRTMPEAWRELIARRNEIPHRVSETLMDVSVCVDCGNYTQLIGAEVDRVSDSEVPSGMSTVYVEPATYLYARHAGPVTEIAQTFGRMYDWARANRVQLDEFKVDQGYTAEGTEVEHDLYVRIIGQIA